MEIERKFLFSKDMLEIYPIDHWWVEKTWYLPDTMDYEIRLRWKETLGCEEGSWKLTIKDRPFLIRPALTRLEIELPIKDKNQIKDFISSCHGCLETKRIAFDLNHFEPDIPHKGMLICEARILPDGRQFGEIEFNDIKEAEAFDFKKYKLLKEDVTNENVYKIGTVYRRMFDETC